MSEPSRLPRPAPTAIGLLEALEEALALVPREDLPTVAGKLESLKAAAILRLVVPSSALPVADQLLDVEQAAARLAVSPDYLYRHPEKFPFRVEIGRSVRFSARGLEEYIRRRCGRNH